MWFSLFHLKIYLFLTLKSVYFQVMMALLRTYTAVDADKAKEDARECVRTAIADPNSFSVDHLLRLSAVQSLEKSDPKIHQVLMLFATGRLADYRTFIADNSSFITDQVRNLGFWRMDCFKIELFMFIQF